MASGYAIVLNIPCMIGKIFAGFRAGYRFEYNYSYFYRAFTIWVGLGMFFRNLDGYANQFLNTECLTLRFFYSNNRSTDSVIPGITASFFQTCFVVVDENKNHKLFYINVINIYKSNLTR